MCVEDKAVLRGAKGSAEARFFVYYNPAKALSEADALRKRLREFAQDWAAGRIPPQKIEEWLKGAADLPPLAPGEVWADEVLAGNLLYFFKRPWCPGKPLELDKDCFREYCFTLGYFALASNMPAASLDGRKALDGYSLRNEVECFFRSHKENFHTTRVHNDETLQGALMTAFLATSLRTTLLHRMQREHEGKAAGSGMSSMELVNNLRRVHLVRYPSGHVELTNLCSGDEKLVESLGFPGLFSSAEKVADLLSAERLKRTVALALASSAG